jgi:hypothetical protein
VPTALVRHRLPGLHPVIGRVDAPSRHPTGGHNIAYEDFSRKDLLAHFLQISATFSGKTPPDAMGSDSAGFFGVLHVAACRGTGHFQLSAV